MKHVRNRLGSYLEGDLPLQQRALVDAHLDVCPSCAEELKELRGTIGLLRSLPEIEPPSGLASGVIARIQAGEAQPSFWVRVLDGVETLLLSRPVALVVASAGVLVLALIAPGWLAGRSELPLATAPTPAASRDASELALRLAPLNIWTAQAPLVHRPMGSSVPSEESATPVADTMDSSPVEPELGADPEMERALRDPIGFVEGLGVASLDERDRELSALFEQASRAGRVDEVVQSLRATGDRRAEEIAQGFEGTSTSASR